MINYPHRCIFNLIKCLKITFTGNYWTLHMVLNEPHIYFKGCLFNIFLFFKAMKLNYGLLQRLFNFWTKLWNVGENYKIQSIRQNASIHRGGSRNFWSRFSMVADPKCRGLRTQPPAADKVWHSKTSNFKWLAMSLLFQVLIQLKTAASGI